MTTLERMAALAFVSLMTGCEDTSPPRIADICVKSKVETNLMVGIPVGAPIGSGLYITTDTVCVKWEQRCIWGKDFKGQKVCDERVSEAENGQ